ncbi:MAG: HAMP domain-containing histidine kinase [Fimbriiglobus sp.]|nr:HAMP domain-containing histidine kinase [Fimbriiglobus sp.]
MSRPWQLRHKLVFGLALVVACVGLLLGGAVFGLTSLYDSARSNDRKLHEMRAVGVLRDGIMRINTPAPPGPTDTSEVQADRDHVVGQLRGAKELFHGYVATHDDIQDAHLDPDGGEFEAGQIVQMRATLAELEEAVAAAAVATPDADRRKRLMQDEVALAAHAKLFRQASDLYAHLFDDVRDSYERSKADQRRALVITGTATTLALVLVLTLLYYFRVWVFRPIKELQAGVHRVHGGNFDQPIRLSSKDELEELANEFNAMTARLRDIYKSLAQQVNERTRQLVRSERMVSVGFLAAGVAHEINNPLASIAFCSEALERRLQDLLARHPADAETIAKYLKMIQQEAFRCKQITQKLLDFSRSGGRREPVDLTGLIGDVLEVAQHLPNAKGKTVEFTADGPLTAIVSGPDVKSVVLNLVVNALDSMGEGGKLKARLIHHDTHAEMTFTDTGCGMTPDVLDNIFEPFFTRSRTGNGTGLGLSISHQIVDQHGGSIVATSEGAGKGSTFTVKLPLSPAPPPKAEAPTAKPRPAMAAA